MNDLIISKEAYVMVPDMRALDVIYFCDLVFNFDSIDFKFADKGKFSKIILTDQTFINKINLIKNYENYKFIIFIWNGSFDLKKYEKDISNLKKINVNFNLFIVGSFHQKDKYNLFSSEFKINKINRKMIIKNLDKKIINIYEKTKIFSLTKMIRHPIRAIRKLFFPKLIFYGFGLIRKNEIINSQENKMSDNFNLLKKYYWEKLYNFNNTEKPIENCIQLFEALITDEKFNKISLYEKYYFLQNFFRHIFIKICLNFKNFEWERFENKLQVYHSPFYNNNYFLDFGSKCDTGKIYSRYLFLKRYDKKILNINFFKSIKKEELLNEQLGKSIEYLRNIYKLSSKNRNLNATKLHDLLKVNYDKY